MESSAIIRPFIWVWKDEQIIIIIIHVIISPLEFILFSFAVVLAWIITFISLVSLRLFSSLTFI